MEVMPSALKMIHSQ